MSEAAEHMSVELYSHCFEWLSVCALDPDALLFDAHSKDALEGCLQTLQMCNIFDLMCVKVHPAVELKLLQISLPLWNKRVRPNLSVLELSSGGRCLDCMFEVTWEDWKRFPVIDN